MKKEEIRKKNIALIAAIMVTALCLRAPITGIGTLIGMIGKEIPLTGSSAGMLTTIPLLVFALLSVGISQIADRMGAGGCMFNCMVLMCLGILLRCVLGAGGLFGGTLLIGVGIAAGNVLIAAIVKAYFPDRIGLMTGIYATVMSVAGGISSGISAPLAEHFGWRAALLIWIGLAVFATLLWLPVLSCSTDGVLPQGNLKRTVRDAAARRNAAMAGLANMSILTAHRTEEGRGRPSIARSGMAWAIVFYFGIQSLFFYTFVAWMPAMIQTKGFDADTAGFFTSAFILIGIPATLFAPIFTEREGDECIFNVILSMMFVVGVLLLMRGEHSAVLMTGTICCGLAAGACFSQSMALFGLRTRDAHDAAALSGLAQSVGYLFAAVGPVFAGWAFDAFGSWDIPLMGMMILGGVEAVLGYIVGKEQIIFGELEQDNSKIES